MKKKTREVSDGVPGIEALLETRSFQQLLKDGDVLDLDGARKMLGYEANWSVRRLCQQGKLPHFRRERRYFFLASQVAQFFKSA